MLEFRDKWIGDKMIECLALEMPDYFTHLLKVNMNSADFVSKNINTQWAQSESFQAVSNLVFKSNGSGPLTAEVLIKNLGWTGIRNRMSAAYVYYKINNFFSEIDDYSLIKDLLIFEGKLKKYSVEGYSRGLLLAIYLKFVDIELIDNGHLHSEHCIASIPDYVIDLLPLASSKIIKIDWILLAMAHFNFFLGLAELKKSLQGKLSFAQIYAKLNIGQKNIYMKNMLNYAYSINEEDNFINDMVE